MRRSPEHKPLSAETLARSLPKTAWQRVTWRAGTNGVLTSRFAAGRARPAHRDELRHEPRPEEWFLIKWPEGEDGPTKYWLSTLPPETPLAELVGQTKLRWRIERDYQELKQEIGLGHYEGRSWRGFHHHASLCIAAYGFLVSERGRFPPRNRRSPNGKRLSYPPVTDPAAPPIRPERHVADSIPTLHLKLARALARSLQRCPCCQQKLVTQ